MTCAGSRAWSEGSNLEPAASASKYAVHPSRCTATVAGVQKSSVNIGSKLPLATESSLTHDLSQIRASPCTAPPGHTFWSAPVQLDALGAAAVVVVPAALAARDATPTDADSAIVVSVTAVEVNRCDSAIVVSVTAVEVNRCDGDGATTCFPRGSLTAMLDKTKVAPIGPLAPEISSAGVSWCSATQLAYNASMTTC